MEEQGLHVDTYGTIQLLRHHVFDFFRPTHLFDDLQYCKSSKIAIFQDMSCEGACGHAHVRCAVARVRVRAKRL